MDPGKDYKVSSRAVISPNLHFLKDYHVGNCTENRLQEGKRLVRRLLW